MRVQTRDYVANFLKEHADIKKVLDVGSLKSSGGDLRDIFAGYDYKGLDMRPGTNVDFVMNAHDIKENFKEGEYDLVICFDMFEHDDAWWITIENLKWLVKSGGWLMIGAPSRYCPEHDHPHDYWRFMPQSPDIWFSDFLNVGKTIDYNDNGMEDEIYAWGQKP